MKQSIFKDLGTGGFISPRLASFVSTVSTALFYWKYTLLIKMISIFAQYIINFEIFIKIWNYLTMQ